jgi:hypothetical protein
VDILEAAREVEIIKKDYEALHKRTNAHRRRPTLEGSAVAAIRRDEQARIDAEADRIQRSTDDLNERLTDLFEHFNKHGSLTVAGRRRQWALGLFLGVAVPIVTIILYSIVYGYAHVSPRVTYFEVSAQVMPVLVLAAALEGRQFDWANRSPLSLRIYNVAALLWMSTGEYAALVITADGKSTPLAFALTTSALFTAGVSLVGIAVTGGRLWSSSPLRGQSRSET